MTRFLRTHGTTLTISLFAVSTISGVFLFFHLYSSAFHAMHEWLSMVLLIPVVVHIWRNWPAFSKYFTKKTIVIPALLSVIVSVAFAYPALSPKSSTLDPKRAAIMAIHEGTIAQVAPLFKLSPELLVKRLSDKGYVISDTQLPLSQIAKTSGKPLGPKLILDIATGN